LDASSHDQLAPDLSFKELTERLLLVNPQAGLRCNDEI
jgi:hypothetical protein